ncbi:hypothetical protein IZ6_30720 [Terrihabitans soli]|uniref:Uncharacterized protein n=1 Tax=Terrihabitans soli TaxID=708113 RepID=A0A6S6QWN6_9HYPH|nr:hypothetical protein IZ6_30720 [Terrihabitans soli]
MSGGIPGPYLKLQGIGIFRFNRKGVHTMIAFILHFFQYAGAASRAGEAARNHRVPSSEDLKILGIPASAFAR